MFNKIVNNVVAINDTRLLENRLKSNICIRNRTQLVIAMV